MVKPQPKVIAVDVDGTLHTRGKPDVKLIEWLRVQRDEGFKLILWSSAGEQHAREVATAFNVTELFDVIIGKPCLFIDDQGLEWLQYTRVITSLDSQ